MTQSLTVPGDGANVAQPSRWIPVADLPVYPVASTRCLIDTDAGSYPSVMDAGTPRFVRRGRYAIASALRALGVGRGDRVLVPAYHCSSMVAPVKYLSAEPVFYRIRDNLSVDLTDLANKLQLGAAAVIATHYFGFHQVVPELREICDQRGIPLLEDCAHAFFGNIDGRPVGSFGDYAVASLWKFFAVPEGGCLISARHRLDGMCLRRPGFANNLSALRRILDQANYYGRLRALYPISGAAALAGKTIRLLAQPSADGNGTEIGEYPRSNLSDGESMIDSDFDPDSVDTGLGTICRSLFHVAARNGRRIALRRRSNYAHLLDRFGTMPGCHPIAPSLPDGVVPYMFPLWIDNLPRVFSRLEDAAIPMQRFGQFLWPGVDERTCPISSGLSRYTIQLPCHQDLDDGAIEYIAASIEPILAAGQS